jgi:hypothetical protein
MGAMTAAWARAAGPNTTANAAYVAFRIRINPPGLGPKSKMQTAKRMSAPQTAQTLQKSAGEMQMKMPRIARGTMVLDVGKI